MRVFAKFVVILIALGVFAACAQQPNVASTTGIYKIGVDKDGLYRLSARDLPGFDARNFDATRLVLTSAGATVPFTITGTTDQKALYFYGQALLDKYSNTNYYWLHLQENGVSPELDLSTRTFPTRVVSLAAPNATSTTTTTVRAEENLLYVPKATSPGDHWMWQQLRAPVSVPVTLQTRWTQEKAAILSVALWDVTQARQKPDHHLIVKFNDQSIGDTTWDGIARHVFTYTVPANLLRDGENQVMLTLPGDTGAPAESVMLDWVALDYTQKIVADAATVKWQTDEHAQIEADGFQSPNLFVLDVTSPATPTLLTGHAVEKSTKGFRIRLSDTISGPRRFFATAAEAALRPQSILSWQSIDPSVNSAGADYILIAPTEFLAAAEPLVAWRKSQGLRVAAVELQTIFDRFSNGRPDPHAIRDFLAHAYTNWPAPAPRFVLLVGDSSYDYHDFLNAPFKNKLPTYLLDTMFIGETASDNWFVRFGGEDDHRPSMAIGRLPAQNAQQVTAMVQKILAYEKSAPAGAWRNRALLVADDDEKTFTEMSEALATGYLSNAYAVNRVYFSESTTPNASVLKALDEGVSLVNYVGHGSLDMWGAEKALRSADVEKLQPNQQLPILVTMTCLTGFFQHPNADSLGETLLRAPNKGIVAALVPTSESVTSQQAPFADAFYRELFLRNDVTIGEALMRAKQSMPDNGRNFADVVETFNLLGDPATRLVKPNASH